ncbi:MAG TPA: glycoside hydrolase family 25 protein [Actinomycetota bacterium]|nr:glycoside hydrolase family 25 protein [Actinomycetota bacterium]
MTSTDRSARIATAVTAALVLSFVTPAAVAQEGPVVTGPSGAAGTSSTGIVAIQPPGTMPGIDVSHWNETIDWVQVADSGVTFAFAKASEGRSYVDPMYATNKVGAAANGVVFGAYHFARPDDTRRDAIHEADHFVEIADLDPGNLIPVLDIERTGGLGQRKVTRWILAWLSRVTERLGVRPMVYTSPNGWAARTGDTTAVADAGYTVLWVAHWGVAAPTVPAENWGGNGWRFWQYTDDGAVPGIDGKVDLDWFLGDSFVGLTIPSPDVTPPTATISPPSGPDDAFTIAFDEIVRNVSTENTILYRADAAGFEQVRLTCRSGRGLAVDCATGNVRSALMLPVTPLIPGATYRAAVDPLGVEPVIDRSGNPAGTTAIDFSAPTELEQDSPAVRSSWRTVQDRDARGGSYVTERSAGAAARFTFSGRSVTWYTIRGPAQGSAAVSIDGERLGAFDQHARRTTFAVGRSFDGLPEGLHTISIRALGEGSGKDTLVAVDGFGVGKERFWTPELALTWGMRRAAKASAGSYRASDGRGAAVELTFLGTGVTWTTVRGPDQGRAEIFVDDTLVRTVDNYARERSFNVARVVSGLTRDEHELRIVVLAEARPRADGALVSVDGFSVIP